MTPSSTIPTSTKTTSMPDRMPAPHQRLPRTPEAPASGVCLSRAGLRLVAACLTLAPAAPALTSPLSAQDTGRQERGCPSVRTVRTVPSVPRAGTLFRVRLLRADTTEQVVGLVAGQPLHFESRGDTLEAFAAMPVDSSGGVTLLLTCGSASSDVATERLVHLAATAGAYRLERLAVDPRFGSPPDSALAERMRREAAIAAAVSREAHRTPRLWTASFVAPRESRITSGFGNGRTFNGEVTSRHTGTDYAGAVGSPVRAVNRGVVRVVDAFHLGGNVIYLDHGAGLVTAYLHLSRQLVAVGDTVARGQVIGHVGATGRVTGPHLHLIARFGTISVDPLTLIGKR
jgi:murein DD-endopeptidase MepM/ murein hydrolase activator NlpD